MYFLKHLLIAAILLYPISAVTNVGNERVNNWTSSDIFVMYNPENQEQVNLYNIDHVSWGPQYNKQKITSGKYINTASYTRSIDIPLIQEGAKYVLCGSVQKGCNTKFWQLRKSNYDEAVRVLSDDRSAYKRALIDNYGELASVPWLKKRNIFSPLADVEDEGYFNWLSFKIDNILKLKPDSIHIDEAFTELPLLRDAKISGKKYHSINAYESASVTTTHWSEYKKAKVKKATDFFISLTEYIRNKAGYPIKISANINLLDNNLYGFLDGVDFVASEIKHNDFSAPSSIIPLLNYKIADSLGVKVVSTAHGNDWLYVKKNGHDYLVIMWIAQAYSSGHYMNFPLKTWVPGSTFEAESIIFPKLGRWIKEVSGLLDGYEPVNQYKVVFNPEIFERYMSKRLFIKEMQKFIDQGVTFDVVVKSSDIDRSVKTNNIYKDNNSVQLLFSPDEIDRIVGLGNRLIEINVDKVYALPRSRYHDGKEFIVVHLLNRDYDTARQYSVPKKNFSVSVSGKLFGDKELKDIILHQPDFEGKSTDDYSSSVRLKYELNNDFINIKIPSLDYWGILEMKFYDM